MKEQELPHGQKIVGFDSLEEMLEWQEQQEKAAIERTLPQQWDIDWGARVFRMVDDLAIWGHVYTEREFLAANSEPGKGPDEEILEELDQLKDSHDRGYRYGLWFSVVEPTGEYGSAHVSTLWEISYEDFHVARRNDWKVWPALAAKILIEMRDAREALNHEGEGKADGTD